MWNLPRIPGRRPAFLLPPRNRPLPSFPVLFLLLRLAQNPPQPEQPTRPNSATQAPRHQPEASHLLPIQHLQLGIPLRLATPTKIHTVLKSWRAIWKDRNEDTAYLTLWKQIQDKHAVLFFFLNSLSKFLHFSHLRRNLS